MSRRCAAIAPRRRLRGGRAGRRAARRAGRASAGRRCAPRRALHRRMAGERAVQRGAGGAEFLHVAEDGDAPARGAARRSPPAGRAPRRPRPGWRCRRRRSGRTGGWSGCSVTAWRLPRARRAASSRTAPWRRGPRRRPRRATAASTASAFIAKCAPGAPIRNMSGTDAASRAAQVVRRRPAITCDQPPVGARGAPEATVPRSARMPEVSRSAFQIAAPPGSSPSKIAAFSRAMPGRPSRRPPGARARRW